jgi:hypothetical protein
MGAPQLLGERIALAGGHHVRTFRDRTIGEITVALDAACAIDPVGSADLGERAPEEVAGADEEDHQQDRMDVAGDERE